MKEEKQVNFLGKANLDQTDKIKRVFMQMPYLEMIIKDFCNCFKKLMQTKQQIRCFIRLY
jgi:hypothetical protein